jgi:hypothetical protein
METRYIKLKLDIYEADGYYIKESYENKKNINIKWKLDIYEADGYYIKECYDNNRKNTYI